MSTSLTPTTKINNTSKARYLLASASNRFFARIIDMIIVGAIIAGLTLILVHTDNYNWNALNLVHS
jgi:hypothetical protein